MSQRFTMPRSSVPVRALLGAILALVLTDAIAAQWATVDDYQLQAGSNSQARAILVDSSSSILVAGFGGSSVAPSPRGVIRRSVDGGATWTTVDEFYAPATGSLRHGTYEGLGEDAGGRRFAVGVAGNERGVHAWVTRRSTDGIHWTTVDTYQRVPAGKKTNGAHSWAGAVGTDVTGTVVFVTGTSRDLNNMPYWTIRRSTDGGNSWSTVMAEPGAMGFIDTDHRQGIVSTPAGMFVGSSYLNWTGGTVKRSADLGATWTQSDTYLHAGATHTSFVALAADSAGSVFALHTFHSGSTNSHGCLIRRSLDYGASWTTISEFPGYRGRSLMVLPSGEICVGLHGLVNPKHALLAVSADGGQSWSTSDDFVAGNGAYGAMSISAAPDGGVLWAGSYVTPSQHWIVRRLPGL